MAKAKKKTQAPRRRSAPRKKKGAWKPMVAGLGGGLGSAGVGYLMVRSGISPVTTAVGLTAAGGVAALTTTGNLQAAAIGATGMGCGQLALALIATQASKPGKKGKELAEAPGEKPERQDAFAGDIHGAFQRARARLDREDEEAAFTDEYEEEAA